MGNSDRCLAHLWTSDMNWFNFDNNSLYTQSICLFISRFACNLMAFQAFSHRFCPFLMVKSFFMPHSFMHILVSDNARQWKWIFFSGGLASLLVPHPSRPDQGILYHRRNVKFWKEFQIVFCQFFSWWSYTREPSIPGPWITCVLDRLVVALPAPLPLPSFYYTVGISTLPNVKLIDAEIQYQMSLSKLFAQFAISLGALNLFKNQTYVLFDFIDSDSSISLAMQFNTAKPVPYFHEVLTIRTFGLYSLKKGKIPIKRFSMIKKNYLAWIETKNSLISA